MIRSYLDAQPDDFDGRKALALILSTQGPALAGLGRPAESEAVLRRASAIQDVLLAERPQNVFVLHARSMTHMFLGRALTALDRLDEAQTELRSALGLFERVGAVAPDTPMMRAPRFLAWTALAEVQRRDGAYEDAIESFLNALTVVDAELARPDPLPRFVGHRGFISLSLANLLREAGSPRDALRMTASAETSLSEALADDPKNPSWLDALRKLHWTNALLHLDLGDPSASAVDARALHVLAGRDATWQRTALGLLARSLDASRDAEAATSTHDELMTWIDSLIADGYTDVDDLAGSEHFAALRGTPAFEARLADLRRRLAPPSGAP